MFVGGFIIPTFKLSTFCCSRTFTNLTSANWSFLKVRKFSTRRVEILNCKKVFVRQNFWNLKSFLKFFTANAIQSFKRSKTSCRRDKLFKLWRRKMFVRIKSSTIFIIPTFNFQFLPQPNFRELVVDELKFPKSFRVYEWKLSNSKKLFVRPKFFHFHFFPSQTWNKIKLFLTQTFLDNDRKLSKTSDCHDKLSRELYKLLSE